MAFHIQEPEPDYWTVFPSRHPFPKRPEDAEILVPRRTDISINDTLPHNLHKTNPQLHLLIPATQGSRGVCRTLTSAMILEYPPPTMIGYGDESSGQTDLERIVKRITRVRDYLKDSKAVHDHDFVLIVDSQNVFFQLPPRVLVQRFQNILRTTNLKIQKKYGFVELQNSEGDPPEMVQRYSQRVLFGASKECVDGLQNDPGCASVPQSSLAPDVYGWKTDVYPDGHLNRPRWLNPGTVIGQAADLRLIYDEVLRYLEKQQHRHSNKTLGVHHALTQMYGRQEVVRELERRRTTSVGKEWLYWMLGISEATNITKVSLRLQKDHRYEYGIGVDYESQLFFNQILSRRDVTWIKYNNITKTSRLQGEYGVPRERRLLLPGDIADLPNPFLQHRFAREETMVPIWNATLDKLPDPNNHSWHNVPLMTNPHSASVPVLVHVNGTSTLRNTWWEKMWFYPWGRALLRKYVRGNHGFDAAQSSLLGGEDWWDTRGGRGGIWTHDESWVPFAEVCNGEERDLFDDGFGLWSKEDGNPDDAVYNQFGNLIKGHAKMDNMDTWGW